MITKDFLWVEKYRPQTIKDCILPENVKETFEDMVRVGEAQNLLLSGGAGCGKTSIARASLSNAKKVVILDEFDYSNAQSTQPALRGFIEEFSKNCRFILTCNFKNRIIQPLHSRCTNVDFKIVKSDRPKLAMQLMESVKKILDAEGVVYEEKVLAELISKYFPDFRRIINELQRYSVSGTIDVGILANIGDVQIKDMISFMKKKEFTNVRKWVIDSIDNDPAVIFRKIYDGLYEHFAPQSIPQAVMVLADYQYKSAFVADQEINLTACLTELMLECEFK